MKANNTTRGNKSEGNDERRKTKKILRQNKTIQTKQKRKLTNTMEYWKRTASNKRRWDENVYLNRNRKLLETKLYSRNSIKGISAWAVPLITYSGVFVKWTREEFPQIDLRRRKFITSVETSVSAGSTPAQKTYALLLFLIILNLHCQSSMPGLTTSSLA